MKTNSSFSDPPVLPDSERGRSDRCLPPMACRTAPGRGGGWPPARGRGVVTSTAGMGPVSEADDEPEGGWELGGSVRANARMVELCGRDAPPGPAAPPDGRRSHPAHVQRWVQG